MVAARRVSLCGTFAGPPNGRIYSETHRDTVPYMATRKLRSFRLDPDLLDRLEQGAQRRGMTVTALVDRYLDEGLRQDEHPGILFVDEAAGRRARVAGTGLDVWEVMRTVKDSGGSITEAAEYLSIPERFVFAAMHYYVDHAYEIDAWNASNDRLFEEEMLRQRRVADAIG